MMTSRRIEISRKKRADKRALGLVPAEAWLERDQVAFIDDIKFRLGLRTREEALRAVVQFAREGAATYGLAPTN